MKLNGMSYVNVEFPFVFSLICAIRKQVLSWVFNSSFEWDGYCYEFRFYICS